MLQGYATSTYKGIYMRPWIDLFMNGIIFMVFVLHLSFFIMYRSQKANLYFALAALVSVIGSMIHSYYYYTAQGDLKIYFSGFSKFFIPGKQFIASHFNPHISKKEEHNIDLGAYWNFDCNDISWCGLV